ncbi:MAG: SDR family NAD(P)-dependent oxidoreductase, partial [Pseudomonadales bacterium]|nr:SDR family NAD(P)-dependent oxidoreductase [Pseudomonadales bacterium]
MGRVQDKVVIITGALGGIGRADAVLFAREGAKLVLTDVADRGGREFVESLGTEAVFMSHD